MCEPYVEMVTEGDWSGIRDLPVEKIWALFDKWVVAVPENVVCYDNEGKTFDRYTAVFTDIPENPKGCFLSLGMSRYPMHPQGFGQHGSAKPGRHLGKKIHFHDLPFQCKVAVWRSVGYPNRKPEFELGGDFVLPGYGKVKFTLVKGGAKKFGDVHMTTEKADPDSDEVEADSGGEVYLSFEQHSEIKNNPKRALEFLRSFV
jgi:hypothetical protein